jgi:hypothetical protein
MYYFNYRDHISKHIAIKLASSMYEDADSQIESLNMSGPMTSEHGHTFEYYVVANYTNGGNLAMALRYYKKKYKYISAEARDSTYMKRRLSRT